MPNHPWAESQNDTGVTEYDTFVIEYDTFIIIYDTKRSRNNELIATEDMAQHFLLSAAARSLDIEQVFGMSEEEVQRLEDEAHQRLVELRWPGGRPICPSCGYDASTPIRRSCPSRSKKEGRPPTIRRLWRCKNCSKQFSVTTGTIFANRKIPFRKILKAAYFLVDAPKGVCSIYLSHRVNCQYKTALVLSHKHRETLMASQLARGPLSGVVEIDATYVGGHRRKANLVKDRKGRPKGRDTRKQKCITVIRERGPDGRTLVVVTRTDRQALDFIRKNVAPGTIIYTDYAAAYKALSLHYEVRRIDHTNEGYSVEDRQTNGAESFFARFKRSVKGTHHRIAGDYTDFYAHDLSWREDHRRVAADRQFKTILGTALSQPPSQRMTGYWQRARAA